MKKRPNSQSENGRVGLVLSGGGARAAYQVGVLRYIGQRFPNGFFPVITGVSAGSINSSYLAGHAGDLLEATTDLSRHWCSLKTSTVFRSGYFPMLGNVLRVGANLISGGSSLAPPTKGLVDTKPLDDFLRTVIDGGGIQGNIERGRLRATAVTATSYKTGQTITFVEGHPDVEAWERVRRRSSNTRLSVDHVMASTAIPLFFPARAVHGEYFGDGSIRQAHPLAPAVHLGAHRILAVSSRYQRSGKEARKATVEGYPPAAQVIGLLLNSIFLDNLDADAERLQRINQLVTRIPSARRWLVSQGELQLLVLKPSRDLGRMAGEFEGQLPRSVRYMIRGLGSKKLSSSDLVSYLLFESEFISRLIRLGEEDARRQWLKIRRFLSWEGEEQAASAG
ncbi:MAG: patatin-like phospholipase family protein [Gemmatimonadota bacterium]